MIGRCSYCGEEHELGPVGEPGSWLEGLRIQTCPEIPVGVLRVNGYPLPLCEFDVDDR